MAKFEATIRIKFADTGESLDIFCKIIGSTSSSCMAIICTILLYDNTIHAVESHVHMQFKCRTQKMQTNE